MVNDGEWILLSEKSGGQHEPMLTNKDGTRILKPVDEADRLAVHKRSQKDTKGLG